MEAETANYGKLIIAGKEGCPDIEFPLTQLCTTIGRSATGNAR